MDVPRHLLRYETALEWLYGRINYERSDAARLGRRSLNLDRMHRLLEPLGDPHARLAAVHVAGTKGKGSTASIVAAVLSAAGLHTGLYTSPHLERLEERIVVAGQPIGREELVELANGVWPAVTALDHRARTSSARGPTFFEVTTAMALLHFARCGVDVAVLEVGLGGRLDSTNVCRPLVSVITSISYDHTRQLGHTLAEIAYEKAGILKPGIPVVSGVVAAEPAGVIRQVARQRAALVQLGQDFHFAYRPPRRSAAPIAELGRFDYRETADGAQRVLDDLPLNLLGRHQAANAATALAAIGRLPADRFRIAEPALRHGLARVRCPARVELVGQQPTILLDTAHNAASVAALLDVLRDCLPQQRRLLVFAATRDKDPAGMLAQLVPQFDHLLLTRYLNNPRLVPPEELAAVAGHLVEARRAAGSPAGQVWVRPTPESAWQLCQTLMRPDDLVCITGSFFLAGEMRALLQSAAVEPARP